MVCGKCGSKLENERGMCVVCGYTVGLSGSNTLNDPDDGMSDVCSCGYLKMHGYDICPNCGKDPSKKTHIKKTDAIHTRERFEKITEEREKQKCLVRLVPTGNDKNNYKAISIYDTSKELKRTDIDENDYFISGRSHIKIFKKDSEWYIENTSSNDTVFLQVSNDAAVKDGDILLLGKDKLYRLEINEEIE